MYKPRHRKKQFKHRRTIARFHLFGTRLTWPFDDWKISKDILWDEMPALGYYWLQNIKLESDPYGKANDLKTNLTKFTVIWGKRHQKTGVLGPISSKRRKRRARRKKGEEKKTIVALLIFIWMVTLDFVRKKMLDTKCPFGGNVTYTGQKDIFGLADILCFGINYIHRNWIY